MECVVLLGAGASAPFGVPTLRHIFTDVRARQCLKSDAILRNGIESIFWKPRGLTIDTSANGPTIEDMLTILRDSEKQDYGLPVLMDGNLRDFRRRLYVLIKRTVYDNRSSKGQHLNPLLTLTRLPQFTEVTWASFNWDCLFESSFYYSSGSFPQDRRNPKLVITVNDWVNSNSKHTFLKLHGGVNWWFQDEKIQYLQFGSSPQLNERWSDYMDGTAEGQPVLLEPSFYKYQDKLYHLVEPQWKHFVDKLAAADLVIVVGYSLPESDSNARSALMLGFQANPGAKWFVVDRDEQTIARYQRLFGAAVIPWTSPLEEVNPVWKELVGAEFPSLQD